MASIVKISEGKYRLRYRSPDGGSRTETFGKERDARRRMVEVEGAKLAGAYVDRSAGSQTFGAYAQQWQAAQVQLRQSTADQVACHLRNHTLPTFATRPLAAVRRSEVQAWVKSRTEVLAPATVEVVYRYLAAIFAAAVEDKLIPVSPCKGIKLPEIVSGQVVPPTVESVEALAAAVPDRYRALVVFAAGTGLRQGECFGVTLDRVEGFMGRRPLVRVDRQLVLNRGGPPSFGPPKTKASRRTVPLPLAVRDAVAAHLTAYPVGPEGLIFTAPQGGGIRRNRFSEVWRPAVERAGLPGAVFHELRHFYASLLIRHGESVKVVQARLGHATAVETLDTYGHLWPDSEDRTREAVDAVFGGFSVRTSDTVASTPW